MNEKWGTAKSHTGTSFGDPRHYFAENPSRSAAPDLYAAGPIAELLSAGLKEEVDRAVKQWNRSIRNQIRNETGLRLSDGDSRISVAVEVVDGVPPPIADVIQDVHPT